MTKIYAAYLALHAAAKNIDDDAVYEVEALAIKQAAKAEKALSDLINTAESRLFAIAKQANDGNISAGEFRQKYLSELETLFKLAAMDEAGVNDFDLLPQSLKLEIMQMYQSQVSNIDSFSDDIYNGRYREREGLKAIFRFGQSAKEGLRKLRNRVVYWAGELSGVVSMVVVHSSIKSMWVVGPTEHCSDCLRLDKQVHTREEWLDSKWRPRSRELECKGYNCKCRFERVDKDTPTRGNF